MNKYYDIRQDLKKYPEAVFIFVYGGRGTGKTYSALRTVIEDKIKFCFIKRTMDDVKELCGGNKLSDRKKTAASVTYSLEDTDISPFSPLNRDFGWNILPWEKPDSKGLAFAFETDAANNPVGKPYGYIAALSAAGKFKGFDISDTDVLIFDEFVPQPGERISKHEGDMIKNFYLTVQRDRLQRGRPPLRMWALANTDQVASPLIRGFGLLNEVVEMAVNNQEYMYIPERHILLHKLKTSKEFIDVEKQSPIYSAVADGDPWKSMALGNNFSKDDFSLIRKAKLKNMVCESRVIYNDRIHYVYRADEQQKRYITYSSYNKQPIYEFDLSKVLDRERFRDYVNLRIMNTFYGLIEPSFEKAELYFLYLDYAKLK